MARAPNQGRFVLKAMSSQALSSQKTTLLLFALYLLPFDFFFPRCDLPYTGKWQLLQNPNALLMPLSYHSITLHPGDREATAWLLPL